MARIEELAGKTEEARGLCRISIDAAEALIAGDIARILADVPTTGRLSDVLLSDPRNGLSVRCDSSEAGTPVLTLSAVTGFRYRETEFKRTTVSTSPDVHYWLHDGDLLTTRSNTPDLVGHAASYSGKPAPCVYPDLMMKLAVDETAADKHFVHWWLRGMTARDYIRVNAKGTSPTMKKVSQGIVKAIPFPSRLGLAEQCTAVERLDALQAKVDELKRLRAETQKELDALMPSILDRAFKGEL